MPWGAGLLGRMTEKGQSRIVPLPGGRLWRLHWLKPPGHFQQFPFLVGEGALLVASSHGEHYPEAHCLHPCTGAAPTPPFTVRSRKLCVCVCVVPHPFFVKVKTKELGM